MTDVISHVENREFAQHFNLPCNTIARDGFPLARSGRVFVSIWIDSDDRYNAGLVDLPRR
jgi:hypothetical protein